MISSHSLGKTRESESDYGRSSISSRSGDGSDNRGQSWRTFLSYLIILYLLHYNLFPHPLYPYVPLHNLVEKTPPTRKSHTPY